MTPVKAIACVVGLLMSFGVVTLGLALGKKAMSSSGWVETTKGRTDRKGPDEPLDWINRIHVQFSEQQRFGIVCPRLHDPKNPEKPKLLTRDERGITNNTCIRVEGYEYLFGQEIPGVRYVRDDGKIWKELPVPGKDRGRAWQSVMEIEYGRIRIAQTVEIVVGQQTRLFDTAKVTYTITNRDKTPHTVGLRVMLDTLIGLNDGVPFYLPPTDHEPARFVDKLAVLGQKQIPEYLQALETGDLKDKDATVAILCPNVGRSEPMEKLVLCRWPQNSEIRWGNDNGAWKFEPMDANPQAKDSCVVMYWAQTNMKPGEQRTMAFTYGLGMLGKDSEESTTSSGKMRLVVAPRALEKKAFPVMAYVKSTDPGQRVTLKLPAGLAFAPGQQAEKTVPAATTPEGYSQVTWKVIAQDAGTYPLAADAPNIGVAKANANVREPSNFD
ncbi:MAG: hypothetical protein JNM56_30755 [Planctomycetia bacterium]|nr:hypothetical protein [Planctomycetia bacterium]